MFSGSFLLFKHDLLAQVDHDLPLTGHNAGILDQGNLVKYFVAHYCKRFCYIYQYTGFISSTNKCNPLHLFLLKIYSFVYPISSVPSSSETYFCLASCTAAFSTANPETTALSPALELDIASSKFCLSSERTPS